MKNFKTFLIIVLSMFVGSVFCFIAIYMIGKKSPDVVVKPTDLKAELVEIGELATADYVYTMSNFTEIPKTSVLGLSIPFTGSKVIYSYSGNIKAGIEFADIKTSVNDKEKKIYISLPETKILSSEIDYDSLEVIDEEYSIFNKFTFEDMNLSVSALKATAEQSALEQGLLLGAENNAKQLVSSFVSSFGDYSGYTVVFY